MNQWSEIPGYNGRYRVSSAGDVQSCHGQNGWWSLSQPPAKSGHLLVYLWNTENKSRVRRLVHQVVAEAFLNPVFGKDCVNHIDGNNLNNSAVNLEWCTRQENMLHAWRTGLCKPPKLTAEKVIEILTCGGNDTVTAKRFGVSQVMITRIRARKAWRNVQVPA